MIIDYIAITRKLVHCTYEFEPVSQVSIDDDWSAMRFRHVDNINAMKRKTAATEKGKERIKEARPHH